MLLIVPISPPKVRASEQLKKKWRNLRDSYMKHLKSIKPTTGQAKRNYVAWPWSSQMERFKPFLGMAKTVSNISATETQGTDVNNEVVFEPDVGNNNHDHISADGQSPVREPIEINRPDNVDLASEPRIKKRKTQSPGNSNNVDKVVQYLEGKNKIQLDATDHLMLGYSKTIKTFSRARQAQIKLQIAQIINLGELEQLREEDLSTSCSSSVGTRRDFDPTYPNDEELEEQRFRVYNSFGNV
ncbi:uncharacterized protein LOC128982656 [Macrosteles quadrilineatus]|uniref:uncharacterized protein LOC128982656 n=1 Tax=Macrosteles quadrilineatus TaxID=74068 RepID=UPI0023E10B2F|nr:uncharacterized protein LOC128982656 [Macrosteles quadrilineatus]